MNILVPNVYKCVPNGMKGKGYCPSDKGTYFDHSFLTVICTTKNTWVRDDVMALNFFLMLKRL